MPNGRAGGCSATWARTGCTWPRWWLGEITELGAVTATFFERGPRPDGGSYTQGEDSALVTARFASGAIGSLQVSAVCWEGTPFGQTHHAEIHGSDGTLYAINDWDTVQEVRGVRSGETRVAHGCCPSPRSCGRAPADPRSTTPIGTCSGRATRWRGRGSARSPRDVRASPTSPEGARVQQLLDAAARSAAEGGGLVDVSP